MSIKIVVPANMDIWLVCQGERISLYPGYCLGQYHSNHIDTKTVLPRYEDPCMVFRPKWYLKHKYH